MTVSHACMQGLSLAPTKKASTCYLYARRGHPRYRFVWLSSASGPGYRHHRLHHQSHQLRKSCLSSLHSRCAPVQHATRTESQLAATQCEHAGQTESMSDSGQVCTCATACNAMCTSCASKKRMTHSISCVILSTSLQQENSWQLEPRVYVELLISVFSRFYPRREQEK